MQQSCVDSYFSETLRGSGSTHSLDHLLGPLAWTLNFWQDAICEYGKRVKGLEAQVHRKLAEVLNPTSHQT
ncbi:hypothetical protein AU210_006379 [Fusarium oxysporum f. sp. radicis-cucumerinum]|uniref:Uncharacterized protein n=1 Tax=Fusarium oxysporum f. sp. radicis-cucumerinum TaxID=327505 RepID=A0A2H3HG90_FUSOX|nr:hypothetical protein AU210_006379 [Fusarium oxysporum f. sp. radicis-cucumerinum]